MLIADYTFFDLFWSLLVFFIWVMWFWLLFTIWFDIFRRDDISGGRKPSGSCSRFSSPSSECSST